MSKSKSTVLVAVLAVIGCLLSQPQFSASQSPAAVTEQVIIQGQDFESLRAAVAASGATITHELPMIRAIAAQLSAAQRGQLEQTPGLRFYEDRQVRSSTVLHPYGDLGIRYPGGAVVEWGITNQTLAPITIASIEHTWPTNYNGKLKRVLLEGTTLSTKNYSGPTQVINSHWHGGSAARTIAPGQTALLRFEYQFGAKVYPSSYHMRVNFTNASPVSFPLRPYGGTFDGFSVNDTVFTRQIGADQLHDEGVMGDGVTIAFIDSGLADIPALNYDADGNFRTLAAYDAIQDVLHTNLESSRYADDDHGHGTHLVSLAMSARSEFAKGIGYNGVAPNAKLVSVKSFSGGLGTYSDVLRGLQFVLDHHQAYNIRVLNLSFSADAQSFYWDDPINQAVMALWQAGVVVVTSAGNKGPDPMTVGVPGNVPYIITVGAWTDNYTPGDDSDDRLTTFTAAGPTVERFIKPDLVAPRRPHAGPDGHQQRAGPGLQLLRHLSLLSALRYLAGLGRDLRRDRPDPRPEPVPQSRRCQVSADVQCPPSPQRRWSVGLQRLPARRRFGLRL